MRGQLKNNQKHITWKQMQDYLQGELSTAEMHRLETHLHSCELCQEALEGLEKTDKVKAEQDMQDLQLQLNRKLSNDKSTTFARSPYWKVAAVILVLILAYFTLFEFFISKPETAGELSETGTLYNEKPKQTLKSEEEIVYEADTSTSVQEESKIIADSRSEKSELKPTNMNKETTLPDSGLRKNTKMPTTETNQQSILTADATQSEPEFEKIHKAEDDNAITGSSKSFISPIIKAPEKKQTIATDDIAIINDKNYQIKGKVISIEDGEPLPGVNVVQKNSQNGTVTDINGNFSLMLTDLDKPLVFAFVGFTTEEVLVGQENSVLIELSPDVTALSEVVVVGYGQQNRQDNTSSFQSAQPSIGNREYKQYIKENLQYPPEARQNNIEGTVVLSFLVSTQGQIQNIEVKKSLGYGCDEEAIRLLRQGPVWQPAEEDGKKIEQQKKIRIKFKLP